MLQRRKCLIPSCNRIVGPRRLTVSSICYTCDRNAEAWSNRDRNRRLEWHRRVRMFNERLDRIENMPSVSAVRAYVKKAFKARLKEVKN